MLPHPIHAFLLTQDYWSHAMLPACAHVIFIIESILGVYTYVFTQTCMCK